MTKFLNHWAHSEGYADFDTYIRAGGSLSDAHKTITKRILALEAALELLAKYRATEPPPRPARAPILEHTDAEPNEPPDPHNAHVQGDDAA